MKPDEDEEVDDKGNCYCSHCGMPTVGSRWCECSYRWKDYLARMEAMHAGHA